MSVWLCRCFLEYKVTRAVKWSGLAADRAETSRSERRHAVQVKAGPLRAAVVFVLVHLRAVAVLVRALRRLVGIIFADLFVLLLLFNAAFMREEEGKKAIRTSDRVIICRSEMSGAHCGSSGGDTHKACGGDCVALLSLWYPEPLASAPFICSWRMWGRECSGMLPMVAGWHRELGSSPPLWKTKERNKVVIFPILNQCMLWEFYIIFVTLWMLCCCLIMTQKVQYY